MGDGAAPSQHPLLPIIPSSSQSRRPANIPLHTLSFASRPPVARSSSYHNPHDEKSRDRRASYSSDSADSNFSLWSDTGDLVDQLADAEDPLRIRPPAQGPSSSSKRSRSRGAKHVHYEPGESYNDKPSRSGVVKRKEDIPIPEPVRRPISRGERFLVLLMAADDGPSRMHGLHGKKLM